METSSLSYSLWEGSLTLLTLIGVLIGVLLWVDAMAHTDILTGAFLLAVGLITAPFAALAVLLPGLYGTPKN